MNNFLLLLKNFVLKNKRDDKQMRYQNAGFLILILFNPSDLWVYC